MMIALRSVIPAVVGSNADELRRALEHTDEEYDALTEQQGILCIRGPAEDGDGPVASWVCRVWRADRPGPVHPAD
jgi:hypothetical protein